MAKKAKQPAPVSYTLRDGFVIQSPVASIGERIEQLKRAHVSPHDPEGFVTSDEVIADARDAASPLHPCFDWDREKVFNRYLHDRARYLMRCYEIRYERPDAPPVVVPSNVRVVNAKKEPISISSTAAMSNEEYRRQVLRDTIGQLNGIQDRLIRLRALTPSMAKAIKVLRDGIAAADGEAQPKPRRPDGPAPQPMA
jgi:hypothetical protein